ncbi:integral membrane protein [Mucor ambiguus]|uniref:Integral membrane protein n=1 Tax=Mucor ambiguus TaxID=91626 RepID=A0A0C9N678_9FUNG|nr:integral membrane protein [Mucor ambiguus]
MNTTPKLLFPATLLATFLQPALADQKAMNHAEMDMLQETVPRFNESGTEPMSYALFPGDKELFYSHIAFMIIGFWCLMPMGVMLGVANSNLHVPIQILTAIFAGNVHHSLGGALFSLLITQVIGGFARKISNAMKSHVEESDRYETISLVNQQGSSPSPAGSEISNGVVSESTLHNNSNGMSFEDESMTGFETENPLSYSLKEKVPLFKRITDAILPFVPSIFKRGFKFATDSRFANTVCRIFHQYLGCVFVLLVLTQTISGMVVHHDVCRFETIECSLIFFYGITNTWMEHFGPDDTWTPKDLEHASLAFMFWWTGLLGILIESRTIRKILEKSMPRTPYDDEEEFVMANNRKQHGAKRSKKQKLQVNFNPIPALTILITGLSLGNHHQDTLYSSRVHYLWGLLISAAAVCRIITYITLFKSLPKSGKPLRPPSEALGIFLLVCGSILFTASNAGTIFGLRCNAVDSMFLLNVTVFLTTMVLSYISFLVLLEAWAENREAKKKSKKFQLLNNRRFSLKQRKQFGTDQDEDETDEEHSPSH